MFIAVSLDCLPDRDAILKNIDDTLRDMKTSTPVTEGRPVYYPGENMLRTRAENMELGISVDETVWKKVLEL